VCTTFTRTQGKDFPCRLNLIDGAFRPRANTLVVPGGKMELAMQLIFTPFIGRMMETRQRATEAL